MSSGSRDLSASKREREWKNTGSGSPLTLAMNIFRLIRL